jgi:sugar O-acyltransferase (sialic acid O-acetyltransferase NeuD family)
MNDLIIVGAGGHGRTLYETATLLGYENISFLDDNESPSNISEILIIGKTSDLSLYTNTAKNFIIGIGNNKLRELFHQQLQTLNITPITLVHPFSFVSPSATLGDGSVVLAGAVIGANSSLGAGTIVNSHSTVDHDSTLGDFAHLGVGVHLAGGANVGKSAFLQAGTVGGYSATVDEHAICPPGTIL